MKKNRKIIFDTISTAKNSNLPNTELTNETYLLSH